MKKIFLILIITITNISIYAGTTLKIGVGYLNNETPKTINIDSNNKKTILDKGTIAPAIIGQFELGKEFNWLVKNFGIVGEIGATFDLGYGKMKNSNAKSEEQNYIPGYLGTYLQLTFAYKFENDIRFRIGARGGIGATVTFLLKEESKNDTKLENTYIPGYAVPFGGVLGFDYKQLIVDLNIGAKYLFAKSSKNIDNVVNVLSFGQLDFNLPEDKLNPLSYDIVNSKNSNKFMFMFGLKIGVRF